MRYLFMMTTLFMSGITAHTQSQDNTQWMLLENRVGLAIGVGSIKYLDKNSSPLVYQSRPKNVRLFYNLESRLFLFALDLDLRVGSNAPKYQADRTLYFQEENYAGNPKDIKFPARGSLLAGRISVGAYYKIFDGQIPAFKLALGGRIMNDLSYTQGWNSGGMFNALSFSPEVLTQYRFNEHHQLTASVRIPVVARLSRLPYDNTVSAPETNQFTGFFRNSSWVGPAKYLAPVLALGYNYQINARWGAGLNYETGWYNIQIPQQMKSLSHSLLANFHHQF